MTLKRPLEKANSDDIYMSVKHEQTKTFNPLPRSRRKYFSTTVGLTFDKAIRKNKGPWTTTACNIKPKVMGTAIFWPSATS